MSSCVLNLWCDLTKQYCRMSIPGKQSSYGEFQIDITLKSIYEYMGVTIFIPRRSQKVKGGFVMK